MQFNTGELFIGAPVEVPEFPKSRTLVRIGEDHPEAWKRIADFVEATAPLTPGYELQKRPTEFLGLTIRISYVEAGAEQTQIGWHRDYAVMETTRVHILSTLTGNTTEIATDPYGNEHSTDSFLAEYSGAFLSPPPNCWVTMDNQRLHRSRPAEVEGWRLFVRLVEKAPW